MRGNPDVPAYRSRAEHDIAALLTRYGIPFVYEKPTAVLDAGKTKVWYPDFTLAHGLLIEYFGVTGEAAYTERTAHKLAVYAGNQVTVIPVYAGDLSRPSWQHDLLRRVDGALEFRLRDYRARTTRVGFSPPFYRRSRGY
jgi:hypothetical protein